MFSYVGSRALLTSASRKDDQDVFHPGSEPVGRAGRRRFADPDRVCAVCDGVIDIAAALFDVSGRELRHPRRTSLDVSRVRQIAMYVTHVSLGMSMRDVGLGFGRDRTTVLHACHMIEDMRDDREFDAIVATTERVISAAFGARMDRGRHP